ncbi:inactive rhomboid protein 2 isoform X2 [Agrilus planipennis]|uniref:Inactive rhomboid protein 2 isoform X2 n=1 Tax=Agrilus planipennis TaxID=224129 RepID=A0A7F5RIW1_AGRPL|nr:inactive rhomboid protein 2 isoform X2 [Agrilus planipennis]
MPADEDYGRRHNIIQNVSVPPIVAPVTDRYQDHSVADRVQQDSLQALQAPTATSSASSVQSPPPSGEKDFKTGERYNNIVGDHRFGSERSHSDRLPSGERYQGVSERYPLGNAMSSDRLVPNVSSHCHADQHQVLFVSDRYQPQKYSERYSPVKNVICLDRYHSHNAIDAMYSRANTPTDARYRQSSNGGEKERCSSSSERRTPVMDKYQATTDMYNSISRRSTAGTPGRHTPVERFRKNNNDKEQFCVATATDLQRRRERSRSADRKQQIDVDSCRFDQEKYFDERFPAIPCPERFATDEEKPNRPERISFSSAPYMTPPSPAPANSRFIPPPPLSPITTPSPDCYASNTFPSPTNTVPPPERFIPPPPLSPSPTEVYSPQKYDKIRDRYLTYSNELYTNYSHNRNQMATGYHLHYGGANGNSERVVITSTNPHVPVERYTPQQQQEPYCQYERYPKYGTISSNDPYMRRDLRFPQYRMPFYQQNNYQRIRYVTNPLRSKCCQYPECYQYCKSSPCSSSSSSVTSQGGKDVMQQKELVTSELVQCQNIRGSQQQQQEKVIQCFVGAKELSCPSFHLMPAAGRVEKKDVTCTGYVSPTLRTVRGQCRHGMCTSPSVEYVGHSGGRRVCATPPPRGSIGSVEGSVCSDQCCLRRSQQNTMTVAIWRPVSSQQQAQSQQTQQQQQQQQQQVTATTVQQPVQAASTSVQQSQSSSQNSNKSSSPSTTATDETQSQTQSQTTDDGSQQLLLRQSQQEQQLLLEKSQDVTSHPSSPHPSIPVHHRAVSLPVPPPERCRPERKVDYSQSERIPTRERPKLERTMSRKDAIKNFIKRETATFFGVDEQTEQDQQMRWLDRRKRLASRTYGPLKDEFQLPPSGRTLRRPVSEFPPSHAAPGTLHAERPDVLPGPSDIPDGVHYPTARVRRKNSVARMTWDGISYVVTTLARHRPRPRSQQTQWSRSYEPSVAKEPVSAEDEVFFEQPVSSVAPLPIPEGGVDVEDSGRAHPERVIHTDGEGATLEALEAPLRYSAAPGWRRSHYKAPRERSEQRREVGKSRIFSSLLDNMLDNSDRRQYGMGLIGRIFGRSIRKSITEDEEIQEQLDDLEDHRPYFTYWVTSVQILVLIISLICYGFGPFGIDLHARSGQVLVPSLSLQQVDYLEPANFWLGPRAADLIHLGAKFSPCMRIDEKIQQQIEKTRAKERETACCIRNDDSGCVQSSRADCSNTISTWKKWRPGDAGPGGRISGSVCGLDPKYCDAPASVHPYEWPDDITKWPICRKMNTQLSVQKHSRDKSAEHMVCEVIGHPCCIGIHGMCKITTKEYCDFVRGNFHEEASLCSQVSCLDDVCGMIPFYFMEIPDQFYRLWTSIFLHAGVLQLFITIAIQYFFMRDVEKLTGSLRVGIIYIGSGVAGNLASAIFVPYRADVGPSGSHFGLLACLIVEVLNAWPMLKHPYRALCKLLLVTFVLFLIGLVPWVDNYAHLFGFVFGFLLSYALLPFISFGPYDRQKKIVLIWVCLLSAGILFACLVLLFYIIPVYDCEICSYFNCLPITNEFCASQNIDFKRDEPVV